MLTVLLVGVGVPVLAETDIEKKIEELEKLLEEIKASIREGSEEDRRIQALEQELAKLKVTIRCVPTDGPDEPGKCIVTGEPSQRRAVFAKAY